MKLMSLLFALFVWAAVAAIVLICYDPSALAKGVLIGSYVGIIGGYMILSYRRDDCGNGSRQ